MDKGDHSISIGTSSPVVWLDAMRLFIRENPDIKVSHTLLKHDRFKDCSCCTKFDFIITAVTDLPDIRWEYKQLIADDKPVIAVYPSHPFAKRKVYASMKPKTKITSLFPAIFPCGSFLMLPARCLVLRPGLS